MDLEQTLQHLEQVIVARDWKSVLTNLHTLKGSAGTIGISVLYLLMSDIEAQLKALAPDFEHDACLALSAGIVAQCRSVAVLELSRIQAALGQRGK
ncbi:Hpt domain-containing protein [Vibrio sp. PP-XX7]